MTRHVGIAFLAAFACSTVLGADAGKTLEIDGLKSTLPADWKASKPANNLVIHQFDLAKTGDDKEDAVLKVMFLQGSGGTADENIKRWKAFFIPPKDKTIDDVSEVKNFKVGSVPVAYVDVHGTYKGAPFEKLKPKADFRMISVYFASKNGPYFFRLVGPAKTVEKYKKGFDDFLMGFK